MGRPHVATAWLGATIVASLTAGAHPQDTGPVHRAPNAMVSTETGVPCAAPGYHELDFWLGTWDVHEASGRVVGTSHIERAAEGCAILEQWTGGGGERASSGIALHVFAPGANLWRQTSSDSRGNTLRMEGMPTPSGFVYWWNVVASDGRTLDRRSTLVKMSTSVVRQLTERTFDAGLTWTIESDYRYTRASGAP